MYRLSEQEVNTVYERLRQEGVSNRKLEEDLLDHFCCFMEERMEQGVHFERAFKEAMYAISPNGLKEIEFELFFIMNFNKQLTMKRVIFSTGFLAAFLLSTGTMFKTMHWPGASALLFLSFATLLLTTLLIGVHMIRFLKNKSASFWFRSISGLSALFLISLGLVFKTFHMPGSNIIYGLGTIILNFVFLPVFFYHIYKHGFAKPGTHEAA